MAAVGFKAWLDQAPVEVNNYYVVIQDLWCFIYITIEHYFTLSIYCHVIVRQADDVVIPLSKQ